MTNTGNLLPHGDAFPEVAPSAWVAPGAHVIGAVHLGEQSSVWYGAVLRGDTEPIRIGARTNVQDGCILHADPGYPAIIGDDCVIGMGATILNGAEIGEGSIVAAGALVTEGKEFPPHSLIVGAPAKPVREVTEEQTQSIAHGVREYVERAASHRESLERSS
jgi:carbonic anhydrase/acetyltransferase-like protein (isoleucine patch superfamily)